MINSLLGLIKNIKLSATEWLAVALAAVFGSLVAALKIQGTELHRAQVKLLDQTLESKATRAAESTATARKSYQEALDAFLRAGGTLLLIWALAIGPPAKCSPQNPNLLPMCQAALSGCSQLVAAQDSQIAVLQDNNQQWKKIADTSAVGVLQSIPWPIWVFVGGILGIGLGRIGR